MVAVVITGVLVVTAVAGVVWLLAPSGLSRDADADGLTDAREREIGTDPHDPDTDGDALPDGVEVDQRRYDLSLTNATAVDLDLDNDNASDADPLVKDIFVEVDRMEDYRLSFLAVAFAQRPLQRSPVGVIELHIDQDDGGGDTVPSDDCLGLSPLHYDDFLAIKRAHFDASRKGVFHYALLANRISSDATCDEDILGQAFGHDDDFLLAYERLQFGGESQIAAVFLHELGHNLGLVDTLYAGIDNGCTLPGSSCFDPALYSNYESVMNYRFQRGFGGGGSWVIDYSDGTHGVDSYGNPDHNDWAQLRYDGVRTPD